MTDCGHQPFSQRAGTSAQARLAYSGGCGQCAVNLRIAGPGAHASRQFQPGVSPAAYLPQLGSSREAGSGATDSPRVSESFARRPAHWTESGPAAQRERPRIAQQGWSLHAAAPYRDTDRSASRYAKKAREDFKRLVGDLEADEFGADVLAIWELSRGSRRVGEWVDLVDLCKRRNMRIWVTTHGRLYDPANARERRSLLEDVVDAEYESDKTSERRKRSARASADAGRPHGRNTYGFLRVYDERTRELVRVEPHPEQAPVVQEAARRLLNGDSACAIARDLNARDIPPRRGK